MGLPVWTLKFTSVFAYFAVHSSAIIPHYDADFSTFSCYRSFIFSIVSRNPVKNALWIKFSVFAFYLCACFLWRYSTGCPKKKWDLCLNAHNTPCKWTTDKSRVSFGKFRKFPFKWAQEHLLFGKKWLRKSRSKLPTPPLKY